MTNRAYETVYASDGTKSAAITKRIISIRKKPDLIENGPYGPSIKLNQLRNP